MDRKAYVYIGKDTHLFTFPAYKIGSSYDPYGTEGNRYIGSIQFVIECLDRGAAFGLEFRLHRYFEYCRVRPHKEWFRLSEDDLDDIRNGFRGELVITDFMRNFAKGIIQRQQR